VSDQSVRPRQEGALAEDVENETAPDVRLDFHPEEEFPPFEIPFEPGSSDPEEERRWLLNQSNDEDYSPAELEEKLAELNELLASNAQELPVPNRTGEAEARPELLKSIVGYRAAWVNAARALIVYKRSLTDRVWMKTVKTSSEWMGRTDRTVRQLIADYQLTERSPELMAAMQTAGYDPAANHRYLKLLKEAAATAAENPTLNAEQVISRVVKFKDPRKENYIKLTPAERRFWKLRLAIRTTVNNVSIEERVELLAKAIGEEAYHVWRERKPFTMSITPAKSVFTLEWRKPKREDA
jgi:hypothetical protein